MIFEDKPKKPKRGMSPNVPPKYHSNANKSTSGKGGGGTPPTWQNSKKLKGKEKSCATAFYNNRHKR
jgi:hypothetical protein